MLRPADLRARAARAGQSPIAAASLAVVLWGVGPLLVRAMSASGLTVAAYRSAFAIPVMFAILYATGGAMTRRTFVAAAPLGALFAADIVLAFSSFQLTSIANATIIGALGPLGVLALSGRVLGERIRPIDGLWFALALAGTAVVVLAGRGSGGDQSWLGDLLALGSLATWVAYFLLLKVRRVDDTPAFALMTATMTWSAILLVPLALVAADDLDAIRGHDFVLLLMMIVGPGAIGHGLMTWATRYVNVNVTSLMTLAMPVVSVIGAWVWFGETLNGFQLLGGAVVLAAIGMVLAGHAGEGGVVSELEPETA